jgi:hypothetical protein
MRLLSLAELPNNHHRSHRVVPHRSNHRQPCLSQPRMSRDVHYFATRPAIDTAQVALAFIIADATFTWTAVQQSKWEIVQALALHDLGYTVVPVSMVGVSYGAIETRLTTLGSQSSRKVPKKIERVGLVANTLRGLRLSASSARLFRVSKNCLVPTERRLSS